MEVTKTRKTTIEVFSAGKSKSGSSRRETFPKVSQRKLQQRGRAVGRQILLTRGSNYQNNKQRWQHQKEDTNTQAKEEEDMIRLNEIPHLRIASYVALVLEEDLKLVHPIIKRLFSTKVLQNNHLARRLKHFHKN